MKISGIYKIRSRTKPQRFYIGSAVNLDRRWYEHLHDLRLNKHDNPKLQNHYNKYYENDLIFIVIEECLPELLIQKEQYYINELKPYFNICKIAGNTLGIHYKLSKETRDNFSKTHLGRIAWNKGLTKEMDERLKMSEESKNKISKSKLNKKRKPFTEEHKKNIKISHIGINT
jgi:group I intron endonuclease